MSKPHGSQRSKKRPSVTSDQIFEALDDVGAHLEHCVLIHGDGAVASSHEALGFIAEEYHELVEAVKSDDPVKIDAELRDLAVMCVFALASRKHMSW